MLVTRSMVRAEIIRQLLALGYRRRHRDGLLYPPPAPIAASSQRITVDPLTVALPFVAPGLVGPGLVTPSPWTVVPNILTVIPPAYSPPPSLAPVPESPTRAQEASLTAQPPPPLSFVCPACGMAFGDRQGAYLRHDLDHLPDRLAQLSLQHPPAR